MTTSQLPDGTPKPPLDEATLKLIQQIRGFMVLVVIVSVVSCYNRSCATKTKSTTPAAATYDSAASPKPILLGSNVVIKCESDVICVRDYDKHYAEAVRRAVANDFLGLASMEGAKQIFRVANGTKGAVTQNGVTARRIRFTDGPNAFQEGWVAVGNTVLQD